MSRPRSIAPPRRWRTHWAGSLRLIPGSGTCSGRSGPEPPGVMRGTLLWLGLHAADLVAISLPRPLAYALADLVGRMWHRLAHERRALVTDQLARVSAATGRPSQGPALRRAGGESFAGLAPA